MRALAREALGYAAASGCALLVDMSILWTLVNLENLHYEIAAILSFLGGSVVAYQLSVRIAFTQRRLRDGRAEFASFVAIGAVGLCVNAAVMFIAVARLGLPVMVGKCIAAGFTFTSNFLCRRRLLFVARPA